MAVSPKFTSSRIRDPLAVRVRLGSLSTPVEEYTLSVHLKCQEMVVAHVKVCALT